MNHRRYVTIPLFAATATLWLVGLVGVAWMNGCGGDDPSGPLFPDGSADAAQDGATGDGGSSDAADAGSGKTCPQLRQEIERWRELARACDPNGRDECGVRVADECCAISVTDPERDEVKKFVAAVREFKESPQCAHICPFSVCSEDASHSCKATGRNQGTCDLN
ncbi:hypothetical protein LZC95_09700 [Pendulispora brunnea]|uniref:Secreted protein n=1 Tax=Pendulispora brunnea TaxID=2905690 RepID=A0ABZ2KEI5_9BACT